MLCMSFEPLLVQIVVICVVVGLVRLLLPWLLGMLGVAGGIVAQAINIVVWGAVAIFVIRLIFSLLACAGFGLLR